MSALPDPIAPDVASLMEANSLDYRIPPALSIATSRAMKSYPALNQSYEMGQTIVLVVSSGASYIDLQNSYLAFTVKFNKGAGAPDITGVRMPAKTGYNMMFQRGVGVHSSGVEVERVNDALGEWAQIETYYNTSKEKRAIQGSLYNFNDSSYPGSVLRNTTDAFEEAMRGYWSNSVHYNRPDAADGKYTVDEFQGNFDQQGDYLDGTPSTWAGWQQKYNFHARTTLSQISQNTILTNPALAINNITAFKEDDDLSGQTVRVVIPLPELLPLFKNTLLAPSYLMAGLRIELTTYTKEHFFQCVQTTPGPAAPAEYKWNTGDTVTIEDIAINLESFSLSESIVRKLAQVSAGTGLEWNWTAVHQAASNTTLSSTAVQVNRALSRADCVIIKTRTNPNINNQLENSFASDPWNYRGTATVPNVQHDGTMKTFQVQLGSLYIPAKPIERSVEYLHSALKTFAQFRRNDEVGGVPLWEFIGTQIGIVSGGDTASTYGNITGPALAISAVPLESSSTLQQSGLAISAQRTAVINLEWYTGRSDSYPRRIDLFIPYTKLLTLMLDSVNVRS